MKDEEPMGEADDALRRSWARLRRNHEKRINNTGAREWEEIDARNHFGEGVEAAMRRWARES